MRQEHRVRVHGDHGTLVACVAEDRARGVDGVDDLGDGGGMFLDEFVADCYGVECFPAIIALGIFGVGCGADGMCGVDDCIEAVWEIGEVEEASEDLHVMSLGCAGDHGGLVAIDAVDADEGVAISIIGRNGVDVLVYLVLALARSRGRVR